MGYIKKLREWFVLRYLLAPVANRLTPHHVPSMELHDLLRTDFSADAMAVMTRAQRRQILTDEVDTCPKEQESGVTSTGMDKVDEWSSEAYRTTCLCQGHGRK